MELIRPFGPEIYQTKLPDEVNSILYQICIKNEFNVSKKRNNNLVGLIEKEFDILPDIQDVVLPALTELVLDYLNTTITFPKALRPVRKRDVKCRASWANVYSAHEYNPIHNHLMDDIVVVCFPKVDIKHKQKYTTNEPIAPGTLVFQYGENLKPFGNTNYFITPVTGDVFIFPAGLKHYTYPVYGEDDVRISTSSNFIFTEYFNYKL